MTPLFEPGQVLATPGAIEALKAANVTASTLLNRHLSGDYGNVCEEDRQANDRGIKSGDRILSSYPITADGVKVWVLTEADRSVTTFLLPEEY